VHAAAVPPPPVPDADAPGTVPAQARPAAPVPPPRVLIAACKIKILFLKHSSTQTFNHAILSSQIKLSASYGQITNFLL